MMGLGYIGLPTAALIASKNINVLGVDIQQNVVDTINNGDIHIVEPALDGLVRHDVERGYLVASTEPQKADVYLVAVPTPFKDDHQPDLKYVESATRMILPHLEAGNLLFASHIRDRGHVPYRRPPAGAAATILRQECVR